MPHVRFSSGIGREVFVVERVVTGRGLRDHVRNSMRRRGPRVSDIAAAGLAQQLAAIHDHFAARHHRARIALSPAKPSNME